MILGPGPSMAPPCAETLFAGASVLLLVYIALMRGDTYKRSNVRVALTTPEWSRRLLR
jgi:hypothetical protein